MVALAATDRFMIKSEAKPGLYSVDLTDYGINVQSSATPHCGILQFTFPENDTSRIQIDLPRRVAGTSVEQS